MANICRTLAVFCFAIFMSMSTVHAHSMSSEAGKTHDDVASACSPTEDNASFEVRSEQEEANVQKAIMRYVGSVVSQGCFPCCFCCGPGDCCDACKKNNDLTAAPAGGE